MQSPATGTAYVLTIRRPGERAKRKIRVTVETWLRKKSDVDRAVAGALQARLMRLKGQGKFRTLRQTMMAQKIFSPNRVARLFLALAYTDMRKHSKAIATLEGKPAPKKKK